MTLGEFLSKSLIQRMYPEAVGGNIIDYNNWSKAMLSIVFNAVTLAEREGCGRVRSFDDYPSLWRKLAKEIDQQAYI